MVEGRGDFLPPKKASHDPTEADYTHHRQFRTVLYIKQPVLASAVVDEDVHLTVGPRPLSWPEDVTIQCLLFQVGIMPAGVWRRTAAGPDPPDEGNFMKPISCLLLMLLITAAVLSPAASASRVDRIGDNLQWGPTVDGVQLSLSLTNPKLSELQVALRNVGEKDVTLNLGVLLANGKFQLPDHISIELKDGLGKTRLFKFADKRHGFVAGRVDDYIVPLRAGSMYSLTVTLDQFWCQATNEFAIP